MTGLPKGLALDGFGGPKWMKEYRRRVGGLMDIVNRAGGFVVWLGLPITDDGAQSRRWRLLNRAALAEAQRRAGKVAYVDMYGLLSRNGEFASYLENEDGELVQVRAPDGVHLERAGGDIIAEAGRPRGETGLRRLELEERRVGLGAAGVGLSDGLPPVAKCIVPGMRALAVAVAVCLVARVPGCRARPGGGGARRAVRAGRAARGAGGGVRAGRAVRADRHRRDPGRGHGLAPRALAEQRPRHDRAVRGRSRPRPLRVQPRLPRRCAESRLRLRALGAARDGGHGADGVRPRRAGGRPPRSARAPVLVLLPLQRLEQPARGRLGDDPARLRSGEPGGGARGAAARGRLQPARGRRAGGVGGRQARDRRRDAPGRLPGGRLACELLLRGPLPRALGRAGRRL